jgi:predicted DNA-binding antitoxin AbrB/MazE fold protein
MVHIVDAIYDQGVLRPVGPLALAQGARVQLRVEELQAESGQPIVPAEDALPTLLERLDGFVGTVHNLPPDASVNLDHYLYGTPKRQ